MKDYRAEVVRVDVSSHPNADRLEQAQPKDTDWFCAVGKGSLKSGDLAIYIPTGMVVTKKFVAKYLSKSKISLPGNRIRTTKIRGYISQGLIIPVEPHNKLGDDVTDELGLVKYEPPEPTWGSKEPTPPKKMRRFIRYLNSIFPKYTKIQNHKNNKNVLIEGELVVITEKIHGTNWRAGWIDTSTYPRPWYVKLWRWIRKKDNWTFVVGSHNVLKMNKPQHVNARMDVYNAAAKRSKLKLLPPDSFANFVFFGEVYGAQIQELKYGLKVPDLMIFDIYDLGAGQYLDYASLIAVCEAASLKTVPQMYQGPWHPDLIDKFVGGPTTIQGADHMREGFVVRPLTERYDHKCGRVILKRISDEYLASKNRTDNH